MKFCFNCTVPVLNSGGTALNSSLVKLVSRGAFSPNPKGHMTPLMQPRPSNGEPRPFRGSWKQPVFNGKGSRRHRARMRARARSTVHPGPPRLAMAPVGGDVQLRGEVQQTREALPLRDAGAGDGLLPQTRSFTANAGAS